MKLPYIGEIDLNNLQEFYEVSFFVKHKQWCSLEIWFDEKQLPKERLKPVLVFLNDLLNTIKKVEEFLNENQKGKDCIDKYLMDHLKMVDPSRIEHMSLLKGNSLDFITQKLREKLYLKSISIWPEQDGIFRFDYTIGHLITDYVICVVLNSKGIIMEVIIES